MGPAGPLPWWLGRTSRVNMLLLHLGLRIDSRHLLSAPGRTTGRLRSTPVSLVTLWGRSRCRIGRGPLVGEECARHPMGSSSAPATPWPEWLFLGVAGRLRMRGDGGPRLRPSTKAKRRRVAPPGSIT
jgi:hypothetical protein